MQNKTLAHYHRQTGSIAQIHRPGPHDGLRETAARETGPTRDMPRERVVTPARETGPAHARVAMSTTSFMHIITVRPHPCHNSCVTVGCAPRPALLHLLPREVWADLALHRLSARWAQLLLPAPHSCKPPLVAAVHAAPLVPARQVNHRRRPFVAVEALGPHSKRAGALRR